MKIKTFQIPFLFYAALLVAPVLSCDDDAEMANGSEEVVESNILLNESICTDFAVKLHESFVNEDSTFLNSYINWELLSNQVQSFNSTGDSSLKKHAWNLLKQNFYPGRDFTKVNALGGSMRFVMYYKEKYNEHHIVLRTFYPPQHLNFYDFTLTSKGEYITINDIYSYEMGCSLTTLLGEQLNVMIKSAPDVKGITNYYNNTLSIISSAQEESESNNITAAYKLLITCDELFKTTNYYKHLEMGILNQSPDEKVQVTAIQKRVESISLEEKGRWLLLFYLSGLERNYAQARLCIQNLKDGIGEDEMLTYLEAVTYYEEGQYVKALELLNKVLASEQDFYIVHYAKLTAQIELSDYVAAIETLRNISNLFEASGINWDKELMGYPDFIVSDEYNDWLNEFTTL
jgi:tetratricopeptide (TPR) repeat protein